MNPNTTPPVTRQTLSKLITDLDVQIEKVSRWTNAKHFKSGSLMLSGISIRDKEFHELLVWKQDLPIPRDRIIDFLQWYSQDLIAQRNRLLADLQGYPVPDIGSTRSEECKECNKITIHTLGTFEPERPGVGISMIVWTCNECGFFTDVFDK